jgi:hypothetical protein
MSSDQSNFPKPWWRFGYVWLVLSGPLLVVIASVVSGWIAFQGNDTDFKKDDETVKHNLQLARPEQRKALTPAVQGRNHAATSAPSH